MAAIPWKIIETLFKEVNQLTLLKSTAKIPWYKNYLLFESNLLKPKLNINYQSMMFQWQRPH
jgi:hypothetical protein